MTYSRIFLLVSLALLLAMGSVIFHHHQMIAAVTAGNGSCVDVAATPDYLSSKDLHDAIAAINYARQREHLHGLQLPADFYQRSAVQQQFVLVPAMLLVGRRRELDILHDACQVIVDEFRLVG